MTCKLLIPIRPGVILPVRIPKGTRRGTGEYDPLLNSIMDYATITPFGIYKLLSIPNTFSSFFFLLTSAFLNRHFEGVGTKIVITPEWIEI